MNKSELVSEIAEETGLSKVDSKKALDAFIATVISSLKTGRKVSLVGFGTFSIGIRRTRNGINPTTKAAIVIPERKIARFKAGAELAEAIK